MIQFASPETRERVMADIRYIPLAEVGEVHPGISLNHVDKWWVVDPKRGVLVHGAASPQCNIHRALAEMLRDQFYPGLEVRLIELVSLPYDPPASA
jgi:hypothetical protein